MLELRRWAAVVASFAAAQEGGGGVDGRRTWWVALDLTVPRDGASRRRLAGEEEGLFAMDLKAQGFFCKKKFELGWDKLSRTEGVAN